MNVDVMKKLKLWKYRVMKWTYPVYWFYSIKYLNLFKHSRVNTAILTLCLKKPILSFLPYFFLYKSIHWPSIIDLDFQKTFQLSISVFGIKSHLYIAPYGTICYNILQNSAIFWHITPYDSLRHLDSIRSIWSIVGDVAQWVRLWPTSNRVRCGTGSIPPAGQLILWTSTKNKKTKKNFQDF
jgi:hypothetical protein